MSGVSFDFIDPTVCILLPIDIDCSLLCLSLSSKAICTEAGLLALRERRMKVTTEDFRKAKENILYRKNEGTPEGLYL